MEYGIGLDTTLGISYEQDLYISKYASELGYTSIWTPESSAYDSFVVCLERWKSSKLSINEGVTTGIAVSPVNLRSPFALAMTASTISKRTKGETNDNIVYPSSIIRKGNRQNKRRRS